nr:MFS transporter [Sphingomonas sp. Y57]
MDRNELRDGWRLIVALHIAIAFGVAVMLPFSIGAFVVPLSSQFGWSRQQIGSAVSIFAAGCVPMSFVVGYLADRFGARKILILSHAGLALCFALYAAMRTLWHFHAVSILVPLLGGGTLVISATKLLNEHFGRHRGLALGLALAGSGVGALIVPLFATWLLQEFGWRAAFAGLALLPLLIAAPLVFLWVRDDIRTTGSGLIGAEPAKAVPGLRFAEALQDYRFWIIAISFVGASGAYVGVVSSLVPILVARAFTPLAAASMMSLFGLSMLIGRLVTGIMLDRLWAPLVALILCLPASLSLLLWDAADGRMIAVLVFLIGLASGSEYDLSAFLVSRYFGLRDYGKIYAAIFAAFAIGGVAASQLYGWAFELWGSYHWGIMASAGGFAVCALLPLMLGRYVFSNEILKPSE